MSELITDLRAIELYAQFRARLLDAVKVEFAPYPRLFNSDKANVLTMFFGQFAQDILDELSNAINDFGRCLWMLDAWQPVCADLNENERIAMALEHTNLLAAHCLNAPTALRDRIIFAVCATTTHANSFLPKSCKPTKWKGYASMENAERLANKWEAWPVLASALQNMATAEFSKATNNFRRQHHHGHPPSLLGFVTSVEQEPDGTGWTMFQVPPLSIKNVMQKCICEHAFAITAFNAYTAFTRELRDGLLKYQEQQIEPH